MYRPKHHRKTNVWIALAALAALAANGCAKDDEPASGKANAVVFGAYVNSAAESRAAAADIGTLKKTGFGVFASHTGDNDFNPDAAGGHTPNFMYNQKVVWKAASSGAIGVGTWFYEPEKNWPQSKVSFFAYAPYAAEFGATGITRIPGPDASGSPKLAFAMDSDADRQIDLLYADTEKTVDLVKGGQVQFRFKHALSRIGFRCASDKTVDGNTTVTINRVTLGSSALGVSGDLDLRTGMWENLATAEMAYVLETQDFIAGSNVITQADGTTASDLTADGKYLMIIPSNKTVPVKITVHYDVETVDTNLAAGKITIGNQIATSFDFDFETGKAYHFTLRLGMRSVTIDAEVSDWDESETDWKPVEKS